LIDRKTAAQIMEIAPDVPIPIDYLLFNMVDSTIARKTKPLQLVPGVIRHRSYNIVGSDIRSGKKLKSLFGRSLWKANEFRRLRYKSKWAWALSTGRACNMRVPYGGAPVLIQK